MHCLGGLSPAAPAAWSATSRPAPVPAPVPTPGQGHPHRSWLASSRVPLAAPPSALLASRVIVTAWVHQQLAGQPQGGGKGFGVGVGGGADWVAFPAGGGVALTGITDSSLALFVGGSCVSPPPAMHAISFVAATLVALNRHPVGVKCTHPGGVISKIKVISKNVTEKFFCFYKCSSNLFRL